MTDDLVAALQAETGLSDHAVRSVLYRLRRLEWRVLKTEPYDFVEGTEVAYINEEWSP